MFSRIVTPFASESPFAIITFGLIATLKVLTAVSPAQGATFTWNGQITQPYGSFWHDHRNWLKDGTPTMTIPGTNDIVQVLKIPIAVISTTNAANRLDIYSSVTPSNVVTVAQTAGTFSVNETVTLGTNSYEGNYNLTGTLSAATLSVVTETHVRFGVFQNLGNTNSTLHSHTSTGTTNRLLVGWASEGDSAEYRLNGPNAELRVRDLAIGNFNFVGAGPATFSYLSGTLTILTNGTITVYECQRHRMATRRRQTA